MRFARSSRRLIATSWSRLALRAATAAVAATAMVGHFGCGLFDKPASNPTAVEVWSRQLGTAQADQFLAISAPSGTGAVWAAGSTLGRLPDYMGVTQLRDAYLVKLSDSGQPVFQRQFGTLGEDEWRGLAVLPSGAAYVVGYTSGLVEGQTRVGGDTDAVVARYAADGTLEWARQLGTTMSDYLLACTVDAAGNLYAVGWTSGQLSGQNLNGASDGLAVKFKPDGTQEWAIQFGSPKEDALNAVALDAAGNLYMSGWATDAVAPGQKPLGGRDVAVYKLQPGGILGWSRQFGTETNDEGQGIAVDKDAVYLSGFTIGTLPEQTNVGRTDGVLLKLGTAGSLVWQRQIGTNSDDELRSVAVDPAGRGVFAVGSVGFAFPNTKWQGKKDIAIVKVNGNGGVDSITQLGTELDDQGLAVAAPSASVLYVAGSTQGRFSGTSSVGDVDAALIRLTAP